MLYGHIEEPRHRVDHVLRLRELQDETGGFQVFIPLRYQHDFVDMKDGKVRNRLQARTTMATGAEALKTFAVSRLLFDNVPHVKVFWVMHGVQTAQLALQHGADDMDGSVVEYKITHDADNYGTPNKLTRDDLLDLIRDAGFRPVERNTRYEIIREYDGPGPGRAASRRSRCGCETGRCTNVMPPARPPRGGRAGRITRAASHGPHHTGRITRAASHVPPAASTRRIHPPHPPAASGRRLHPDVSRWPDARRTRSASLPKVSAMALRFTLDPELTPALRDQILSLWTDVSNAGGAVGFVAPVGRADVALEAERHYAALSEGRAHMVAGFAGDRLAAATFLTFNTHRLMRHWAWLYTVMVDPSLQGRGYGRAVVAGGGAGGSRPRPGGADSSPAAAAWGWSASTPRPATRRSGASPRRYGSPQVTTVTTSRCSARRPESRGVLH